MPNFETAQALLASAAQVSSGAGASVDLGTRDRLLRQTLAVTVATGTADVRLEASADGASWKTFASFARASAIGSERITAVSPERFVRVAWTLGAGAAFTFAVSGTRGVCYANLDDLDAHGLPAAALSGISPSKRAEALAAASSDADGKLGVVFDLPLLSWGTDLTKCVCKIAAYELLSTRGFNPDGADANVRDRHNDAWRWLREVADLTVVPTGIVDSTADVDDSGVAVSTTLRRGWR